MPQIVGVTRRDQPSKSAEGTNQIARVGGRGEVVTIPLTSGTYPLADEGGYFRATNPTPGTAISHVVQAAFSATAALACLRNTDSEGAKRIYLDYIDIVTVVAPASSTSAQLVVTLDNTNRFSSGGTALTPLNANMDSAQASIANLNFGAVVLTAASGSVRQVGRQTLRTGIPVVGDQYFLNFGQVAPSSGLSSGTGAATFNIATGPVILGGGDSLNIHLYYPANATTAATYEVEFGWWER